MTDLGGGPSGGGDGGDDFDDDDDDAEEELGEEGDDSEESEGENEMVVLDPDHVSFESPFICFYELIRFNEWIR